MHYGRLKIAEKIASFDGNGYCFNIIHFSRKLSASYATFGCHRTKKIPCCGSKMIFVAHSGKIEESMTKA